MKRRRAERPPVGPFPKAAEIQRREEEEEGEEAAAEAAAATTRTRRRAARTRTKRTEMRRENFGRMCFRLVAIIQLLWLAACILWQPTPVLGQTPNVRQNLRSLMLEQQQQQQEDEASTNRRHLEEPLESLPLAQALQQQQQQRPQEQAQKLAPIRTVNPGDRVNIPCSLANMGGSIQFAKDDQPIILDSGCAHCQLDISNDGQASLTINRVSQRDQGHWQCWRLDANGSIKQKIPILQLVVTNSPELPILMVNDKELLGGNNLDATISVKENEIVSFKCVIKGASTPVDYVQWMLDSSQNVTHLSQLMMEYSAQDNNYLTQSVLKLNATKSMNLKSVSCLTNHQLWLTPMTVTAFLNVLYEPSFTISREPGFGVPVSEGMSVILKCEIDSNPSSAPIWIKDADTNKSANNADQQQQLQQPKEAPGSEPLVLDTQEDGSVVFQPARRSDSGWYRCKTENKYGNFSSFGYYLNVRPAASGSGPAGSGPQQLAGQQQVGVATSGSVGLQRSRQSSVAQLGAPPLDQSSTRVLGPNQPAAQVAPARPQYASFLQGARLQSMMQTTTNMINNDQPSAAGPLQPENSSRCPNGPARGAQKLEGFPEIEHPVSTVHAVLGRQLVLPLRFCCNPGPARVFWIHRHLAMIPGRMFGPYITREVYTTYNSLHCYESTFEIESVKPEDIGTVYVFVSNEKGHAGAQIHIQLAKQVNGMPVNNQNDLSQLQQNSLATRFSLLSNGGNSSSSSVHLNWLSLLTLVGLSALIQINFISTQLLQQQQQPQTQPRHINHIGNFLSNLLMFDNR